MRLANTLHPYYQESWLSKAQAQAKLAEQGFPGVRVTGAWCQQNHIEVASTGHIRLLSLQHYIDRRRFEEEQAEQDLQGDRHEETGTHAPDCRCGWCEPNYLNR